MFSLNDGQQKKLGCWAAEQDARVAAKQGREEAYYGPSGGAYTFSFTPSSLGVIVTVKNGVTNEEIDLTDYGNW